MLAIYKDASKGHLDNDSVSVNQDGQCHGQHLASIVYLWASTIPLSCIYHAMFLPCFHHTSTAFLLYFNNASTMIQPYFYHASTGVYLLGNRWCSPWSLVSDLTSSGFSSSPIGVPVPLFSSSPMMEVPVPIFFSSSPIGAQYHSSFFSSSPMGSQYHSSPHPP